MLENINVYLFEQFGDEDEEEQQDQEPEDTDRIIKVNFDPTELEDYQEKIEDQFDDITENYREAMRTIKELSLDSDSHDDVFGQNQSSVGKLYEWIKKVSKNYPIEDRFETEFKEFAVPLLSKNLGTMEQRKTMGERAEELEFELEEIKEEWDSEHSYSKASEYLYHVPQDIIDTFNAIKDLEREFREEIISRLKGNKNLSSRDWYDLAVDGEIEYYEME